MSAALRGETVKFMQSVGLMSAPPGPSQGPGKGDRGAARGKGLPRRPAGAAPSRGAASGFRDDVRLPASATEDAPPLRALAPSVRDLVKGAAHPLFVPGEDGEPWYELSRAAKAARGTLDKAMPATAAAPYVQGAKVLLKKEVEEGERGRRREQTSDDRWMDQLQEKGTLQDRVAAMTLRVTSAPLHSLDTLDQLLALAAKKERRTSLIAVNALKDLFIHTLLPDRRLLPVARRPLRERGLSAEELLFWYFESCLAQRYGVFLGVLERGLRDTVESHRRASMELCVELLSAKPEAEQRLLALLVNKLGDPDRKMASKATQLLNMLLEEHSAMAGVVAKEVQQLLHRPKLSARATYAAVSFLNQLKFQDGRDADLAEQLVQTYFRIFEASVAGQGAASAAAADGGGDRKKALRRRKDQAAEDRALGNRLLAALLTGVARAHPYCAAGGAEGVAVVERHAATLFRMVHVAPAGTAAAALQLLLTLCVGDGAAPAEGGGRLAALRDRFYRALYGRLGDADALRARKASLWLNLVFKAMRSDPSAARCAAFAKRLAAVALHAPAPAAAGILYLLSEVGKAQPVVAAMIAPPPAPPQSASYDPLARDPAFAVVDPRAGESPPRAAPELVGGGAALRPPELWEVGALRLHAHPSVAAFAEALATDARHAIAYAGDPLRDFALGPFLNRFAFRNPKQREILRLRRGAGVGAGRQRIEEAQALGERAKQMDEAFLQRFDAVRRPRRAAGAAGGAPGAAGEAVDFDQLEEDPEEEAFAMQLAEKLLRSQGGATFDDEDPDMDGWDDLDDLDDDDDDDDEEEGREGGSGADGSEDWDEDDAAGMDDDDDALLEAALAEDSEDDDSDDDDSDGGGAAARRAKGRRGGRRDADADAFMDDDEDEDEDLDAGLGEDGGDAEAAFAAMDGDLAAAYGEDGGVSEEEEEEGGGGAAAPPKKAKSALKRARERASGMTFASADDFADLVGADDAAQRRLWEAEVKGGKKRRRKGKGGA